MLFILAFEDLWKQLIDMFAPWIQPLDNNGQILSPWIQGDVDNATLMMAVFVESMRELQAQFEGELSMMIPFPVETYISYYRMY